MKKTLFTVLLIVAIALSVTVISCSSEVKAKSSENYITLSTEDNSKFTLTIPCVFDGELEYSTDAKNWKEVTATDTEEWHSTLISCTDLIAENGKLYLKGNNTTITKDSIYIREWRLSATSGITLSGNIMTLLNCDNPATEMTDYNKRCFFCMFQDCTSLTDVSGLTLPATTLVERCYSCMFKGCTNLTKAPELPATTLVSSCYNSMFYDCTNLTDVPDKLPATTLTDSCYNYMFKNCKSLTKAPELPAETLAKSCYSGMFSGCSSLENAPALPAKTLAMQCYYEMFNGCTKLTSAPELPAETLVKNCYFNMFKDCSNLKVSETTGTNKIFTCPSTKDLTAPVKDMFTGTSGSFKGTPTSGTDYYWYL